MGSADSTSLKLSMRRRQVLQLVLGGSAQVVLTTRNGFGASHVERPMHSITRHFSTVENRQVHYRMAGSGPPVVMLHMSPLSSLTFESVMQSWADAFTLIAPGPSWLWIVRPTLT